MFRTPIVLVDNEEDHLNKLNHAFALSGLPCLPIQYRQEPDNVSGIDHIDVDAKHARIIALDINLTNAGGSPDAKKLYGPIATVLEKLAPLGPYYLVFWSRCSDMPDQIMTLLKRDAGTITAPIGYGYLDKTVLLDADSSELKDALLKCINDVSIFKLLLGWELRTNHAASHTLSDLYHIAAKQNNNGWEKEETKKKFITLLTCIAHESVGRENSVDSANHAVEAGLLPILEDNLLGMTSDEDHESLNSEWRECLEELGVKESEMTNSLSEDDISNLNAFYNLEKASDVHSKCQRGIFVSVADNLLSDPVIFSSAFGSHADNLKNMANKEFLFKGDETQRNEIVENSTYGWLEIGAACDHAQLNNKLHRYLFGMLVSAKFKDLLYIRRQRKERAHDGIYKSPLIKYQDNNYFLLLSARYQIGVHPESELLGTPLFRMKEQILNEIAFHWSKHSIRPGFTSFR